MAGLKIRLEASSVPECVVASVILAVVFILTFDILSKVVVTDAGYDSAVTFVSAVRECHREFSDGLHPEGTYTRKFDDVTVEAELKSYTGGIQQLILTVFFSGEGKKMKYYYLIEKKYQTSMSVRPPKNMIME